MFFKGPCYNYSMRNKTSSPKMSTQRIKGTLYAFEDFPYWDAEKKQMHHKRNYIGKIGESGELIPNKAYTARQQEECSSKESLKPVKAYRHQSCCWRGVASRGRFLTQGALPF